MGTTPRPSDAIVLTVRDRIPDADSARRHELRHFTAFGQTDPPRTVLFGFSSGAELSGLPHNANEGLMLVGDAEVAAKPELAEPDLRGPLYRLRLDQYLDRLRREKVNCLKVTVFDERKRLHCPYATDFDRASHGANVTGISAVYLQRLEELVRKTRQRGIVIVLSLFSSAMLREPGWSACPFNARNNNTGDGNGHGSFINEGALSRFCVVREPAPGESFAAMSLPEKLFVIQRELVTHLVETVRQYWNVVFEICDDPRGPGDPGAMAEVIPWHVTVAGWLSELLRDRRGRRRRCIEINARPRLRAQLLDALGAREDSGGAPLVDLVHLRGGEWGGYPGSSQEEAAALRSTAGPGAALYAAPAISDGLIHREVPWDGVESALARLDRRAVAAVLDTDGHHLAQKLPRPYIQAARARGAHFVYRWPLATLHRVDVAKESYDELGVHGQVCPARGRAGRNGCVTFGLDQRLEQCAVADGLSQVTEFPLPPPAAAPKLLSAAIVDGGIELQFQPPPEAPEGYALFVGTTPETVWAGTDQFPDPLPIQVTSAGGRVLLPPITEESTLFIAVAATRGVLTSDLSDVVGPLFLVPSGSALLEVDLPSEIETRHDFRGSVTFMNTSTDPWRGSEIGVLASVDGLHGPLSQLFFPFNGTNLSGHSDQIEPGHRVTVDLREIVLEGFAAETYGTTSPVLLPYSHQPLQLRIGIARRQEIMREGVERPEIVTTPIGEASDRGPDGRPLQVTVRNPQRLGTRYVPEAQVPVGKGVTLPLADGIDRSLHLFSLVADKGAPGTVVRSSVVLERLVKEPGWATRVLRVSMDRAAPLSVTVDIVRLHPIDLYGKRPPRHKVHELNLGADNTVPLAAFPDAFTLTCASSTAAFTKGEAIRWETLAATPPDAAPSLLIRNVSGAAAPITTFTAEIFDDLAADSSLLNSGALTFDVSATVQYVPISHATAHRYFVHKLSSDRAAVVRGQVVLRAGADGIFQRELEVSVDGHSEPVTVTFQILEVKVDAQDAATRTSKTLHPSIAARILAFFNSVQEPTDIVETIRDNRAHRRDTRRAYAIRPSLALKILVARKKQPEGVFKTVDDIAKIVGIGPDTFEDIVFTFHDDGTPVSVPG